MSFFFSLRALTYLLMLAALICLPLWSCAAAHRSSNVTEFTHQSVLHKGTWVSTPR